MKKTNDDIKVVTLDTSKKKKLQQQEMLDIIDAFRDRIVSNDIEEFVISSVNADGDVQIYVYVKDLFGGIGLFELGKQTFINESSG